MRKARVPAVRLALLLLGALSLATPLAVADHHTSPQTRSYIGEDIVLSEPLRGDVYLLGGSLHLEGNLEGDIVAIASDVTIPEGVEIEGSVYLLGGSLVAIGPVRGRVFAPRSLEAALASGPGSIAEATRNPWSLVTISLKLGLALAWLLFTVLIVIALPSNIRATSVEIHAAPFYSFFLGLVALSSFAVTALAFSYLTGTGIGEILLFALAIFALSTKVYGMVSLFHAIGWKIFRPRTHDDAKRGWIRGDLALAMAGLLLLTLVRLIPVVGNLVWAVLSLVATGAALSTLFGSREPAFVSYQPVRI